MMKTYMARPGTFKPQWLLVDATDKVVGRLASDIAVILMGKHRPTYTPHVDTGDFVIVLNAAGIRLTGRKRAEKFYDSYSGYPGGYKTVSFEKMLAKHPDRVITMAVRRMLPKNRLARKMLRKLKVYAGAEHPHQAQQPQELHLQ